MSGEPKERLVEMTPERIERMLTIIALSVVFGDLDRQRVLVARVLARSLTNDELYELVQMASTEPIPDPDDPAYQKSVKSVDGFIHNLFEVREE